MNKKIIIIGGLLAVLALVYGQSQKARAYPSFVQIKSTAGEGIIATTTTNTLTPGTGTTTLSWANEEIDANGLYIALKASTTAATLQWSYQWSNNNVDWYEQDSVSDTTGISQNTFEHASTTITHRWTPGNSTASTTMKALVIPPVPSKYARVQFTMPIGSSNALLYAEVARKRLPAF